MAVTAAVDLCDPVDPVMLRPKRGHLGMTRDALEFQLACQAMHALEMPEAGTRRCQ